MSESNIKSQSDEIVRLRAEIKSLQIEIDYLDLCRQQEVERHDADIKDLTEAFIEQKRQYESHINQLSQGNDDLQLENSEYRRDNANLESENYRLKRQLNEATMALSEIQTSLHFVDLSELFNSTDGTAYGASEPHDPIADAIKLANTAE